MAAPRALVEPPALGDAGGFVRFLSGLIDDEAMVVDFVAFVPEMRARHCLHTFLRVRATCRGAVWPSVFALRHRLRVLASPEYVHVEYCRQEQLGRIARIYRSGVLLQLWAPWSYRDALRRDLVDRRGLLFDGNIRPWGMSASYWDELKARVGPCGHGWIDGKLCL